MPYITNLDILNPLVERFANEVYQYDCYIENCVPADLLTAPDCVRVSVRHENMVGLFYAGRVYQRLYTDYVNEMNPKT